MIGAKRFKTQDVHTTYKAAYSETFEWETILEDNLYQYLNLHQTAYNCPITVAMGAILPLVAALAGPDTRIAVRKSHQIPLNTYVLCVTDPGGGKTFAVEHFIDPVMKEILKKHKVTIGTWK